MHVLYQSGAGPEHGPPPRRILLALLLVTMALLTTEPGEFFHLCQGLLPGYSGMKWVSSRILFELSGSKAAANNHFSSIVGCCIVATTRTTNGTPVLHSFIYWDVGEPTRHPGSTTGMLQDNHLLQLGVTWDIYSRELLCHREEVLSVMRIVFSESVVFHLVFWVSSFVVFVWFVFVFGFDFGRHLAFCFSPVLEQRENS